MTDDKHFQGVNDLNTGAVVTNLTAVTRCVHKFGDQSKLSLQQDSTGEVVCYHVLLG